MKVSKKAYYGLRAVIALASTKDTLSIHDLSTLERLPAHFLEKILQDLRRSGIVTAEKGADGGYRLARAASHITVWDIVSVLEGEIKMIEPPKPTSTHLPCPQVSHCQTNEVWRELEKTIEAKLIAIKISSLIPQYTR